MVAKDYMKIQSALLDWFKEILTQTISGLDVDVLSTIYEIA
jgi:hypothetical protein